MKKVAFHTLGCKLNFSETSAIARSFEAAKFVKVDFSEAADVYVINTCSVTANADKECRSIVRKALKQSPNAFVAITGCFAQLKPGAVASIPGVDLVLGANEKFDVLAYLGNAEKRFQTSIHADEIKHCNSFTASFSSGDRTRSFLKVQDGCDYFCSFCTIPLARGKSRSDTIANTLLSAGKAIATGAKEIVLTGVNLGDFGIQLNEEKAFSKKETFYDLMLELEKLDIERLRISSIEPNLLSEKIIDHVASSNRFVPHFHIPLQSGSDAILKAMRRKYNTDYYKTRIEKIKSLMPNASIGVDVIVGFPGETEIEFQKTLDFLHALDISYLHVFTYSERANTGAIKLKEVVPSIERAKRSKILHALSDKKKKAFYLQNLGHTEKVLFESEDLNGRIKGFTGNYIKVSAPFHPALVNTVVEVTLTHLNVSDEMECLLPDDYSLLTTYSKAI